MLNHFCGLFLLKIGLYDLYTHVLPLRIRQMRFQDFTKVKNIRNSLELWILAPCHIDFQFIFVTFEILVFFFEKNFERCSLSPDSGIGVPLVVRSVLENGLPEDFAYDRFVSNQVGVS